jgi:ferredoxin-NADP reductase
MVYLDDPNGGKPWRGAFSIASAPSESKAGIELAVKVYGDFTKRLQTLAVGDQVGVHGPFGIFTMRPGTDRLVMFGAGIGVTPFRSMIRESLAKNEERELVLVYVNRTQADTVLEQEFRDLAKMSPRIRVHLLLTRESPDRWDGMLGRLDAEKLQTIVPDCDATEFLMCGPEDFMSALKEMLLARGVDVKTKLRKELFS